MPNSDRPKVGPADPETRRQKLHEKLMEPSRAEGVADHDMPMAPKKKKKKGTTLGGLLDPSQSRERTMEGEDKTLTDVVSEAVDSAPKRPIR